MGKVVEGRPNRSRIIELPGRGLAAESYIAPGMSERSLGEVSG